MLKEQSWLIPFLIFPTRETEPAKRYFFPSASKNLLFLPLYTSHYHSVLSKSHFAAPSEGKSIFWKISCHSVVFTGSLYHFSKIHLYLYTIWMLLPFSQNRDGSVVQNMCNECLLSDFKSTTQECLLHPWLWKLHNKSCIYVTCLTTALGWELIDCG